MKLYIKSSSSLPDYKDYWVYKEILDYEYIVDITKSSVTIKFDDGDVYAKFTIRKPDPHDPDDVWAAYLDGELVSDSFDYTDSYNDIVCGCLHYFWTRF